MMMEKNRIVAPAEWIAARKRLLEKEKAYVRMRDKLSAARRELPWVRIDKAYEFDGPDGPVALVDLFADCSQLIVYHFMLAPGWDEGCGGCSFVADHLAGPLMHLPHHDVALAAVSRAPIDEIEEFRRRMGWEFVWVSSFRSDFNYDFNVSFSAEGVARGDTVYNYEVRTNQAEGEAPGASVFFRDTDGTVYHTYSCYARGLEDVLSSYMLLDLTPVGRNESGPMDWVRLHDSYTS
jgi:predicted dithiol-disulfide oxidoreductase (DUF899 family)